MARLLDLSEEHVSILAHCLGHKSNVQKLIFRLPLDTFLLSKAAKLLLTVNDGVQIYARQTFSEIDFDIDELCPEDEGFEDGSGNESDAHEKMKTESEKEDDPEKIKNIS